MTVMNGKVRILAMAVSVGLATMLVGGCSDKADEAKKVTTPVHTEQPADDGVAALRAKQNAPLSTDFAAVELGAANDYINILTPVAALRYYTALRGWDESPEEIVESATTQISPAVRTELPALYEAGHGFLEAQDAFKKKELAETVLEIVRGESSKVGSDRRVMLATTARLDPYDFNLKGFKTSGCAFSDKQEYSNEEMRSTQAMSKAAKPRCYFQMPMVDFQVGLNGGSKLLISVPDEDQARKIEQARPTSHLVVYGYVQSVQRERLGGKVFNKRYVIVAPQRVDLVDDKTGTVLISSNI